MHLSAAPRRRPVHIFSNHTPRPFEVQDPDTLRQPPEMLGSTGMVLGPTLVPSASAQRTRTAVQASDSSVSEGSVAHPGSLVSSSKSSPTESSCPTSLELPLQAAAREPFLDKMMTQTNLLVLPPSNPSYQMAYFLKTTGPVGETAQKSARGKRISSAMRLFKSNSKSTGRRPSESLAVAHQRLNDVLSETQAPEPRPTAAEPKLPDGVVQKVSKTGKKYFQIEQTSAEQTAGQPADAEPTLPQSPNVLDSRVSIFLADQASAENLSNWILTLGGNDNEDRAPARGRVLSTTKTPADCTVRILDVHASTPIRPPASCPSSPAPVIGVDCMAEDEEDFHDKIAPLRSHPILSDIPSAPVPLTQVKRAVSNRHGPLKAPQLAHPSPRRVGSRSLLLQRASSDTTGLRWSRVPTAETERSVSDNPGPPPPRSPLRLQSYPQPMDSVMDRPRPIPAASSTVERQLLVPHRQQADAEEAEMTALPQFGTEVVHISNLHQQSASRDTSLASSDIFNPSKLRSKYSKNSSKPSNIADTLLKPSEMPRRRLKRARPEGPRPLDLSRSRSHVSLDHASSASCAGSLPMKRSTPLRDVSENVRAVPTVHGSSPKIGYVRRPTNAFLRGRKSPAPRPRSAKVRSQARSTPGSTRSPSPVKNVRLQETPVLPSPPPKKELPPTPTKKDHRTPNPSISRKSIDTALARACSTKALPSPPTGRQGQNFVFPSQPVSMISPMKPQVVEKSEPSPQSTEFSTSAKDERVNSSLEARLAAIERRNRLLEAALMAVLKTSGTLNGCPCSLDSPTSSVHAALLEGHHKPQCSVASGKSESSGRDVLDLFKETKKVGLYS